MLAWFVRQLSIGGDDEEDGVTAPEILATAAAAAVIKWWLLVLRTPNWLAATDDGSNLTEAGDQMDWLTLRRPSASFWYWLTDCPRCRLLYC